MQNTLKIKRTKTALAFNLAIIACEIAAIIIVFFKIGCYPLIYYTEDSNLFALVACAVMAGFQVRYLKSGKEIPHSVQMFKYMAAAMLSVTFIVVLAVLSPMRGEGINGWLYMLFNKDFTIFTYFVSDSYNFIVVPFLKKNLTLTQNQLSRLQSLH